MRLFHFFILLYVLISSGSASALISDKRLDRLWPEGIVWATYGNVEQFSQWNAIQKPALKAVIKAWERDGDGVSFKQFHPNKRPLWTSYCVVFVSAPRPKIESIYIGRNFHTIKQGSIVNGVAPRDVNICQRFIVPNDIPSEDELIHYLMPRMGYLLGFYPEHNRPDRDQHISIDMKTIPQFAKDYFLKLPNDSNRFEMSEYDTESVMHSPSTFAFYPDIEAKEVLKSVKPEKPLIQPTHFLSFDDVIGLENVYDEVKKKGRYYYDVCGAVTKTNNSYSIVVHEHPKTREAGEFTFNINFDRAPFLVEALKRKGIELDKQVACLKSTVIIEGVDSTPTVIVEQIFVNDNYVVE